MSPEAFKLTVNFFTGNHLARVFFLRAARFPPSPPFPNTPFFVCDQGKHVTSILSQCREVGIFLIRAAEKIAIAIRACGQTPPSSTL